MSRPLSVLFAEDRVEDIERCRDELGRAGFDLRSQRVDTPEAFAAACKSVKWDIILADYTMPRFSAVEALHLLRELGTEIPLIVVTGTMEEETVVDCLKRGADDYIFKENLVRLGPAVEQVLQIYENRRERKRLEEQLRHAQKMETVGTLASGIAHDFNNVLTAIFGHLDMIRDKVSDRPAVVEHVECVEQAAQRAVAITRALLAFSRHSTSVKQFVSAGDICQETSRLVSRLMPATISQEWNIPDKLVQLRGDPTQIQQMLMNLLVNARDAMPEGGILRVCLRRVDASQEDLLVPAHAAPGPYARFDVADTGVGIAPEVKDRIFEPFFTTKQRGDGTGLGLAIVHGIVENHGGWVEVKSEPGVGTQFSVFLPCVLTPQETSESTFVEQPRIRPHTGVLVVEDNDMVRSMMASSLKNAGCNVFQAGDSIEALDVFRHHGDLIHVVVVDLELPSMNGIELLEWIRTSWPDVPGVIIAGRAEDREGRRADHLVNCTVLRKPFQMQELFTALSCLLPVSECSSS